MARVQLFIDSSETSWGYLTPIDAQMQFAILDAFYHTCVAFQYGEFGTARYEAQIELIEFSNPFDIVALFKNITEKTASFVLDRTIFFQQESERRALENDAARQEIISKKLENLAKANELRLKMIEGGASGDDASALVGRLLTSQKAKIKLPPARQTYEPQEPRF